MAKCSAEAAGYDGMFGIYCNRPSGHSGFHLDTDYIAWLEVTELTPELEAAIFGSEGDPPPRTETNNA